ncbi:MAG: hypothetical protein RJA22_149 [Verrucomicrobiota bacterium]|jgi:superfamily II DNA or RNA helicase
MPVELTTKLLSDAAGWEAMKRARSYLAQDQVLSSDWKPPLLRGIVQAGESSYSAGLKIEGPIDIENLCTCRDSREWGKICAHSVAIGLHWIEAQAAPAPKPGARHSPGTGKPPAPAAPPTRPTPALRRDPSGDPAELHLILPPNFDQAAARGRVMLVVEASWDGGRCPLNALPKDRAFAFSPQDNAVLDRLEDLTGGQPPGMLQIETRLFISLLPALAGHPRVTLGKSAEVGIHKEPFPLPLRATLESNGEISLAVRERPPGLVLLDGGWAWRNRTLQPLGLPEVLRGVLDAPLRVPRAQVPLFLSQFWTALEAGGATQANFTLDSFTLATVPPRFLLELKGGLAILDARLRCAYGPRLLPLGGGARPGGSEADAVWMPDPDSPTRYATRDTGAERAALARLQRAGFSAPDPDGILHLKGQDAVLNFLAREFPRLEREWEVTLEERLERSTREKIERIQPRFEIRPSGVQWFDLGVVFESTGGETFSAADIQRLILGGQNHTRLRNGKVAVIDTGAVEELQEVLLDCAPQQNPQGYRMSSTQAGFLESTLRQHPAWKVQAPAAWRDRAQRQFGEAQLPCPPLGPLESVLRPYQRDGVAWMRFLRENGFGGILADEMGLGKTLQALAHLASLRTSPPPGGAEGPRLPHLIVCPTSLVFNWLAEARKFTPDLKVLALHGPDRHARFAEAPQADLIVTSYALIRRDAERYAGLEFDTVILDEAQHIKNRQTQNSQAVKSIRSRHRLVLTGTPLENSVLDLWSIFDFLMPGYLGGAQDFRERYEIPIAKDQHAGAQERLGRRLRPFLLRRLKREVAADLPVKLEQVSLCELTPDQRAVYQQVIEASRKEVLDAAGPQGLARSRMVVLNALLRLRQICCDLRLLQTDGNAPPPGAPSGKLELFGELLEEVLDGGHRVLVFSQFTSMLALLKERLAQEDIPFCYLDGSTPDRAAVVDRFQKTPGIPVFLISLKAGGVGLNLTAADTVIHFDPWWNPAVEDQATDRAHRIGQTRVVTSYKLIARDTIEEKILQLQQRKRAVIQATVGDEAEFAGSLNWDEIQELLQP